MPTRRDYCAKIKQLIKLAPLHSGPESGTIHGQNSEHLLFNQYLFYMTQLD